MPSPQPLSPHTDLSQTISPQGWWGMLGGMRCGRMEGKCESGWTWNIASEGAVWLWLNVAGEGLIWGENDRFFMKPGMYALTGGEPKGHWSCHRQSGNHRLEVIRIDRIWLLERLGNIGRNVHEGLADWLAKKGRIAFCGLMGVWEKELCSSLAQAVSAQGPARLLAEARLLEWIAHRLVRAPRQTPESTTRRDPVKHALQILRSRLDLPLDLASLAREVGISPHHLSRQVSADTGTTLLRHLRRMRVEHACEALASGRMNVTEVALETGYQSLSHFAKAFREETGKNPSEWLRQRS